MLPRCGLVGRRRRSQPDGGLRSLQEGGFGRRTDLPAPDGQHRWLVSYTRRLAGIVSADRRAALLLAWLVEHPEARQAPERDILDHWKKSLARLWSRESAEHGAAVTSAARLGAATTQGSRSGAGREVVRAEQGIWRGLQVSG